MAPPERLRLPLTQPQAPPDTTALLWPADGDRLGLVLGGRSLGGRIASHLAAQGEPCAGLVLLCYPLHPSGRPERLRTAHWPALRVPTLFLQGDRDSLCDLELLERERRRDEVVAVVAGWLAELLPGPEASLADRE